jgi:hypothetical protein
MKKYYTQSMRRGNHTINRKKADWIGHILRRNCLLEHVTEGKIEGRSGRKTKKKTYAAAG